MKTSQKKSQKAAKTQAVRQQAQSSTLMAVQEKLGLFAPITPADTQETHQVLTKKPLGYI